MLSRILDHFGYRLVPARVYDELLAAAKNTAVTLYNVREDYGRKMHPRAYDTLTDLERELSAVIFQTNGVSRGLSNGVSYRNLPF